MVSKHNYFFNLECGCCSSIAETLQHRCKNVAVTLQQRCKNVAVTLQQRCKNVAVTLQQRCSNVAATLQQRCNCRISNARIYFRNQDKYTRHLQTVAKLTAHRQSRYLIKSSKYLIVISFLLRSLLPLLSRSASMFNSHGIQVLRMAERAMYIVQCE